MSVDLVSAFEGAVMVVGASGGIGQALAQTLAMRQEVSTVWCTSRSTRSSFSHPKAKWISLNLEDELSLARAATQVAQADLPSMILVATGILHGQGVFPERALKEINAQALAKVLQVNTVGPALLAKHFVPLLPKDVPSVLAFLGARVGSVSDNRAGGWYAYRASKAALVMIVKTLSIELRRTHPLASALCLHPGTVRSPLSAPFVGPKSKRKCFSPQECAEKLISVLETVGPEQSGMHLDHAGLEILG